MTNEQTTHAIPPTEKIIQNVRTLDLTGMSATDLANVTKICNVGLLIIPEELIGTLATIELEDVQQTFPVPEGKRVNVRTINGPAQMGGDALIGADEKLITILMVNGPLIFTSPVQQIKAYELIINGPIFAPQASDEGLNAAIRVLQGPLIYYNTSGEVKIHAGQAKLGASALANENGNPDDILFVGGQLLVSGEVTTIGYRHIYVGGQAFIPKVSEAAVSPYLQVFGQTIWYTSEPRTINGNEELGAHFFSYLPEPITLIINGVVTLKPDVQPELLRTKVTEIMLNGVLEGSAEIVPLLQALTKEKNGMITIAASGGDENE